jgi:hypothetical protein
LDKAAVSLKLMSRSCTNSVSGINSIAIAGSQFETYAQAQTETHAPRLPRCG